MIWVSNKADLQYYNGSCYCTTLGFPSDMLLQGSWSPNSSPYTLSAEVWTPDGNTILEILPSSYYEFYIFEYGGLHYFTFRLKSYTSIMCAQTCFLMRIGIRNASNTIVFAAWTEQYCIKSCCDTPRGIIILPEGMEYGDPLPDNDEGVMATGACGEAMVRIVSISECYNAYNGKYYGTPANIIQGSYIPFADIHVILGWIKQQPRNIERTISYNCRIQRNESFKPYRLFSGAEPFPTWRMSDIEDSLQGQRVYIDDYKTYREYEIPTGVYFERANPETDCEPIWKLDAEVRECPIRQTFSCPTDCSEQSQQQFFVIPDNYDNEYFFDQNGNVIGQSLAQLVQWLQSQGLIVETMPGVPCLVTAIYGVTGDIIPPVIFWGTQDANHTINPLAVAFNDICDYIPNATCAAPVIASITDEDLPCEVPIIASITDEDIVGETFLPAPNSNWGIEVPETEGTAYDTTVEIRLRVQNSGDYTGAPGTVIPIAFVWIVTMPPIATPVTSALVTAGTDNIGNVSPGWQIQIDNAGKAYFTGNAALTSTDILEIDLTFTYNL